MITRPGSSRSPWPGAQTRPCLLARPATENVTGPFGAFVEITMEVRTTTGGTMAEVDGMVVVTLILED